MALFLKIILLIAGVILCASVLFQTPKQDDSRLMGLGNPFGARRDHPKDKFLHKVTTVSSVAFMVSGVTLMFMGG